ncbi:hypothetical protein CHK_1445 [Christensenella hongkongensis]|uniref:Uncharacterized protein n=1 Tax=Christensenella hongkongensis TaxID=270498 RepID=A0A0M2NFX6_9FIRM|nr:hypothetical protein CHK_1445 [Christensenella hongkongensis]
MERTFVSFVFLLSYQIRLKKAIVQVCEKEKICSNIFGLKMDVI